MDASPHSSPIAGRPGRRRASELLEELIEALPGDRVSVGDLIEQLKTRAFGVLLLLLALPMCIPNIPGISTVFAVAMFVPAIQMTIGRREVWVPQRVRAWSFSREAMAKGVQAALPFLRRIERLAKPRWCFLFSPPTMFFWGALTLVMAFVLVLPIPGGNWPVGVTVAALALAMLQEDGVLGLISVVMAAITVAIAYAIVRFAPKLLIEIGQALDALVSAVLP